MYKQIGILTGGGDAPGLNAVIRAVVRTAVVEYGMKCIGIEDSFEGILGETHTIKLTPKTVSGILPRGGTILGTRNRGSFVKMVDGKPVFPEMPIGEALANLDILGIEALIVLGGEGTLAIAEQFHKRGFPIIGVPKTIDNDLAATELTFGFMTAIDIATEALDRLHTTAASHDRVMILEVMGRNTGWIALHCGLAGSPFLPGLVRQNQTESFDLPALAQIQAHLRCSPCYSSPSRKDSFHLVPQSDPGLSTAHCPGRKTYNHNSLARFRYR